MNIWTALSKSIISGHKLTSDDLGLHPRYMTLTSNCSLIIAFILSIFRNLIRGTIPRQMTSNHQNDINNEFQNILKSGTTHNSMTTGHELALFCIFFVKKLKCEFDLLTSIWPPIIKITSEMNSSHQKYMEKLYHT